MLNSSNRCEHCGAIVRNVDGRRLTIERLTAIHDDTCPGLHRGKPAPKKEVTSS